MASLVYEREIGVDVKRGVLLTKFELFENVDGYRYGIVICFSDKCRNRAVVCDAVGGGSRLHRFPTRQRGPGSC